MEIKCGIQLYTVRDYCQTPEQLENTLAFLAEKGVTDIQISGIGDMDWALLPAMLDKYSMKVCVTHTPFDRMLEQTDKVIDEHIAIGCDCLGIGSMPSEYGRDLDGARNFIKDLLPVAERMRQRGVRLAYHNHNFDLVDLGNGSILDKLSEIDGDLLWFIPDVAWMLIAGFDPAEYLNRLEGRVKVMHFKDYYTDADGSGYHFTELGKGVVDLRACYDAAKRLGIGYIMFEQDNNWTSDALTSCAESFEFMKKLSR